MIDNPWLGEYLQGIRDFADGKEFDSSKSDGWQGGWEIAREDEEARQAFMDEEYAKDEERAKRNKR